MAHSGFKPEDLYQPVSEETSNQTAQDSGTSADTRVPGSNKEHIWGKQNLTFKGNFNLLMSLKSQYLVTTQMELCCQGGSSEGVPQHTNMFLLRNENNSTYHHVLFMYVHMMYGYTYVI